MKNKDFISAYMSVIGKKGGKKTAQRRLKEDPDYFRRLRQKGIEKQRKRKELEAAGDKSDKPCIDGT